MDGRTNITIELHISNCLQVYINLEGAAEHIYFQLPNERTKVQNILESVDDYQNSKVYAAVLAISYVGCGMSSDFGEAYALLLPTDPVANKMNKRKKMVVSEVTRTQGGVGTIWVSLHWRPNE